MRKWLLYLPIVLLYVSIAWAEDQVSIQGKLLMLDDKTPHVAVPVEVIRNGEVIELILSDGLQDCSRKTAVPLPRSSFWKKLEQKRNWFGLAQSCKIGAV